MKAIAKWKVVVFIAGVLVALFGMLSGKRNPWQDRAKEATEAKTAAQLEAVDARDELGKERIQNDHDKAVADIERQTEEGQAVIADDSDAAVRLRAEEYASRQRGSSG